MESAVRPLNDVFARYFTSPQRPPEEELKGLFPSHEAPERKLGASRDVSVDSSPAIQIRNKFPSHNILGPEV